MEYIAFLFLGMGVLLVLAGVLLQANEKRQGKLSALDEYLSRPTLASAGMQGGPVSKPAIAPAAVAPIQPSLSSFTAEHQPLSGAIPGPFQFVQNEPAEPKADVAPMPTVSVSVQKTNPLPADLTRLDEQLAALGLKGTNAGKE